MTLVIEAEHLSRSYVLGEVEVPALQDVSLRVESGELMAIMGPSGSGKSTLMNLLGCLDRPTSGTYRLDGEEVEQLDDDRLAEIRNRRIGFVFQTFHLLPRTTALENCELPLIYSGMSGSARRDRATESLQAVGLADRIRHHPNELSGGQQQRVAIARALVNRPTLILADEPTGNLDSKAGVEIMRLLQSLNQDQGITVILVTHDPFIARHARRVIRLHDGKVVSDEQVAVPLVAGESVRPSEVPLMSPEAG
ncbi:MAG: ABC transporter ATP-binding protein [Anaerolineales bacterium]